MIFENDRERIIHDVRERLGDNPKAKALAAQRERNSTYQKLAERFYWHIIGEDVKDYIKNCQKLSRAMRNFQKRYLRITRYTNTQ